MSWQSTLWAVTLKPERLEGVCDAAHVTLCLLANRADERGRNAFYSVSTMAKMRGLNERTIRRHLAQLEAAGLIVRGDQRFVAHIPANKRPVVWNLCHRPIGELDDPDLGVTSVTPQEVPGPVDNSPSRGDIRVTPNASRGDTKRPLGVTPGVRQEVINNPIDQVTYLSNQGDAEIVEISRPDRECIHDEIALMYHDKRTGTSRPRCPYCRQRGDFITLKPVEEPAHA